MNYYSQYENEFETKTDKKSWQLATAKEYRDDKQCIYHCGNVYNYDGHCYRLDPEPVISVLKWLQQSGIPATPGDAENISKHVKALTLMRSDRQLPYWTKPCGLENAKLIPFDNGLLNLETKDIHKHSPNYLSLYCLPFAYDPSATSELWTKTLFDIFEGDEDRIKLLQEWFGYCLSADTSHQKFMLFCGLPRAGKGTISEVLRQLIGKENTTAYSLSRLTDRFSSVALRSAQLAIVGEAELTNVRERNAILERLKSITGNDPQVIERKGISQMETVVLPVRFLISANSIPVFYDNSGALSARMLVLNFHKTFQGKEDQHLGEKLLLELPGIANWALEGLQRLNQSGWTKPKQSQETKEIFEATSNTTLAFVRDCLRIRQDWITPQMNGVESVDDLEVYEANDTLKKVFDCWSDFNDPEASFIWWCRHLRELMPKLPKQFRITIGKKRLVATPGVQINEYGQQLLTEYETKYKS